LIGVSMEYSPFLRRTSISRQDSLNMLIAVPFKQDLHQIGHENVGTQRRIRPHV